MPSFFPHSSSSSLPVLFVQSFIQMTCLFVFTDGTENCSRYILSLWQRGSRICPPKLIYVQVDIRRLLCAALLWDSVLWKRRSQTLLEHYPRTFLFIEHHANVLKHSTTLEPQEPKLPRTAQSAAAVRLQKTTAPTRSFAICWIEF